MDDDNIRRRLEEFDAAVSKDAAQIVVYCEDSQEEGSCELIGNRAGFLRAGIELLKAGVASLQPGDSITPISIGYLIQNDRSLRVKRLTRQEEAPPHCRP